MIICGKYGINRSRTVSVTERRRFSKSRSSDLEDIGQGQRSTHATHLLMLVIICTKYENNPSRTVDATERTQFSRSRQNDLEDIGQGQGSSHATHPLVLLIICTKYGKNPSWTVDATERTLREGQTDKWTDGVKPIYTPNNFVVWGYNNGLSLYHILRLSPFWCWNWNIPVQIGLDNTKNIPV